MKKIAILAILVLAVGMLLLSGCTQQPGTGQQGGQTGGEGTASGPTQDQLWIQKATHDNDPAACDSIQDTYTRDTCYKLVSFNVGDSTACSKITNEQTKNFCYSDIAKKARDASVCDAIVEQQNRDGCYLAVAKETKDASVCENISEQRAKQACESSTK